jgi:c(7)-type cytochrome triheme protein
MGKHIALIVVAALAIGGLAFAGEPAPLTKLPKPAALKKDEKSPGTVLFKHDTHVKMRSPDCTTCHPKMWSIRPGAKKPEIKHKAMKKGEYCGRCHESTKAFGLDECDKCHASE